MVVVKYNETEVGAETFQVSEKHGVKILVR